MLEKNHRNSKKTRPETTDSKRHLFCMALGADCN